jgi:hypothetical protein
MVTEQNHIGTIVWMLHDTIDLIHTQKIIATICVSYCYYSELWKCQHITGLNLVLDVVYKEALSSSIVFFCFFFIGNISRSVFVRDSGIL